MAATRAQDDPHSLFEKLQKLPHAQQQLALDRLRQQLPDTPLRVALTAAAATADAPQRERTKEFAHKRPKKAVEFPLERDPLQRRVDYLFGVGTIVTRGTASPPPPPAGKRAPKPAPPDLTPLHHALHGAVPDADKAVAALLQRLDADPHADAFAAFLQSWRNGDESFYEALDRTAGTPDSVFFYDAMLGDFRVHFARRLGGGLQKAHDALHDAFLTYRSYRAFREAVAWSLVLPIDEPLPARLARYDERVPGSYSLRQQVVMCAAALDHDLDRVVALAIDGATPLPEPLWSAKHDPYATWTPKFIALQATMIDRAGSTDAFLQQAEEERRVLANTLSQLAAECVRAAAADKAH